MISVIIPTYNEAAVIEETLRRAAVALPVAIEVALLNNYVGSETVTFRGAESSRFRQAFLKRLLRYERICLPGAVLNCVVTLLWVSHGGPIVIAAAAGVVAGGLFNFVVNIPPIWRTWASRSPGVASSARDKEVIRKAF
jgi:putative flippase GtrA